MLLNFSEGADADHQSKNEFYVLSPLIGWGWSSVAEHRLSVGQVWKAQRKGGEERRWEAVWLSWQCACLACTGPWARPLQLQQGMVGTIKASYSRRRQRE